VAPTPAVGHWRRRSVGALPREIEASAFALESVPALLTPCDSRLFRKRDGARRQRFVSVTIISVDGRGLVGRLNAAEVGFVEDRRSMRYLCFKSRGWCEVAEPTSEPENPAPIPSQARSVAVSQQPRPEGTKLLPVTLPDVARQRWDDALGRRGDRGQSGAHRRRGAFRISQSGWGEAGLSEPVSEPGPRRPGTRGTRSGVRPRRCARVA